MSATVRLKIRRQEGPQAAPRWEVFEVRRTNQTNVITCLQEIQRRPVDAAGTQTTPVAWDCN